MLAFQHTPAYAEDPGAIIDTGVSTEESIEKEKGVENKVVAEKPLPSFVRNKEELPEDLLKIKREGRYFIIVPTIGYDPDGGFTVGVAPIFFRNRSRDNPLFRVTPYGQVFGFTGQVTTRGIVRAIAFWDQPNISDSPWRVRAEGAFIRNPVTNYYGIGSDSLQLILPGTGEVFTDISAYDDALKREIDGTTNARFNQYLNTRAVARGAVEYDLLGGWLRPQAGFQVARIWVTDYTGDSVDATNAQGETVSATQNPTKLATDCASGVAIGCEGGWDNYIKVGLAFDTRNFEPDPRYGLLFESMGEFSLKIIGSSFNYGRWTNTIRGYGNVLPNSKRPLVIAGRFLWNWQFGDVPFYSMNTFAFSSRDQSGLGGFRTIRGYRLDRFIGPVSLLANLELRWDFLQVNFLKQDLKFALAPFIDYGRPFDDIGSVTLSDWQLGGGGGIRLAWNLASVISFDYAVSSEGSAFYMEIDHSF